MSKLEDTGAASAAAEARAPVAAEASLAASGQISPTLPEPANNEPAQPIEGPKAIEIAKPIEITLKAVEAMKPDAAKPAPQAVALPAEPLAGSAAQAVTAEQSRSRRFTLLAASVAFAGAFGAMAGVLAATMIARAPAQSQPAVLDLTTVQDSIAGLRTDLSSIKSSVDSHNRGSSAQLTKFTERLDRIDRAQAAPAAQFKQTIEAIERLERRVQTFGQSTETTGSVRPQQAAVTPPPEPPRPPVIEGWVVRHVSRGVAVIQGRRMGTIEVETGDIVPGVGRIESIRRQDGRWVVVTSKGMITSPQPR